MLKSVARSILCAMTAACFALGTLSQGAMQDCTMATDAHAPSADASSPTHAHSHGSPTPGALRCALHLCCANLATVDLSTTPTFFSVRPDRILSFDHLLAAPHGRIAHLLPFANPPPLVSL
jgi:hypothetical protein